MWSSAAAWARRRLGALRWRTALLLLAFLCVVMYAGIVAPRRPLFGWVRVVSLDIDAPTEEPVPGDRNLFFLETSCVVAHSPLQSLFSTNNALRLAPRAACALEAAATSNPSRPVFLVHTCSLDADSMWSGAAPAYALAAISLPNVHVWPINTKEAFADSPLQRWLEEGAKGATKEADWWSSRVRDALRYVLLWKYGGTYLDSDVLVLRSLEDERDFVSVEWSGQLSAVMMDFSWNELGRRTANESLEATAKLRPVAGLHSEADAIEDALVKLCSTSRVSEMTVERCGGFRPLPPSAVYPVPFERWWDIFEEHSAQETMDAAANSLAMHAWNKLSADAVVDTSSTQPFAQVARRVCPGVVAAVGEFM